MSPHSVRVGAALLIVSFLGCRGSTSAPSGASGPAPAAAPQRPSQILITVESFAGRRVVPFGGTIAMPRLSELAARGTVYDDATSTTTLSRPALVSILTGVSPDRSGVRDNIHDALGGDLPTVAERAREAGYETAAFVSTPFASYSSGLQRGFELFDGPEAIVVGPAQHAPPVIAAEIVAAHVAEWLGSRDSKRPYFAWVHFSDLTDVSVPLPLKKIQLGDKPLGDFDAYDAKLASIDGAIGAILDAVRGSSDGDRVMWTLAATQGTYLGEDGRFGSAFWLADETLRVPVVTVAPGGAPGGHDSRPTWLPDVAASLAKRMGVNLGDRAEGVPLEDPPAADRVRMAWNYALDDQLAWPPNAAARAGASFDPNAPAVAARPAEPRVRRLSAAAREAVTKSGLKLGTPTREIPLARPEPWLKDLQVVRRFLGANRPALANERVRAMIKIAPNSLATAVANAFFFSAAPRKDGPAVRDALLERFPERSDALHWAAHIELVDKRNEQAEALLLAALDVGPVEPEMYYDLACVRSLKGDTAGALAELDRALSAGYRNWDWIDKDPDLATVRADRGFPALLRTHGR